MTCRPFLLNGSSCGAPSHNLLGPAGSRSRHAAATARVSIGPETVEHALDLYGEPVYVRKEIVHNKHVVEQLQRRGAIFVEETAGDPRGREGRLLGSRGWPERSRERQAPAADDRCDLPLVTKVHVEARKFAEQGYTVILIGHEGHE